MMIIFPKNIRIECVSFYRYLNNNSISQIELASNVELKELDLQTNEFTSFPDFIVKLPKLEKL